MNIQENFDCEYALSDICFPCIYFLFKEGDVVYVGQTRKGLFRAFQHLSTKEFDTIKFIKCDPEKLNEMEIYYISKYSPLYNVHLSNAYNPESLKKTLKTRGYRVRKKVIKDWIVKNMKRIYFFHGDVFISENDKEFVLENITNILSSNQHGKLH